MNKKKLLAALVLCTMVSMPAMAKEHEVDVANITGEYSGYSSDTRGGAINNSIQFTVNNAVFKDNTTQQDGGAMFVDVSPSLGENTITGSTFENNSAVNTSWGSDSGALSIRNGIVNIKDTNFTSNKGIWGGAIYAYTGNNDGVQVTMDNVTFTSNEAVANGAVGNFASQRLLSTGGMTITNSKFITNKATGVDDDGGGGNVFGRGICYALGKCYF